MKTFKTFTLTLALLTMAGSVAFAQNVPNSNCPNGQCNATQPGYGSAWSRSNNYESAYGNSNDRYNTHSPAVRPASGSGANDFPELPASWSTLSSRSNTTAAPADSFSRPAPCDRQWCAHPLRTVLADHPSGQIPRSILDVRNTNE